MLVIGRFQVAVRRGALAVLEEVLDLVVEKSGDLHSVDETLARQVKRQADFKARLTRDLLQPTVD